MKLRLLVLVAFVSCLTGCFDMTETFNLKEDGSGVYELKMDMSRAFAMMAMFKQGAKAEGKTPQKLDSIIYYKTMTDTVTTLSVEEKAAVENAYAKIHLDEEEGDMFVNMYFPFKDSKQLTMIQKIVSSKGNSSVFDAVGKALGSGKGAGMDAMAGGGMTGSKDDKSGLPNADFEYTLGANSFSRKVKTSTEIEKPATKTDEMPAQFKDMMKINYVTIVNLPRPAKNLNGKGTLSEDKKQVKFTKSRMLDEKHAPVDYDFSIDY